MVENSALAGFKEAVAKSKGRVVVIVHPTYRGTYGEIKEMKPGSTKEKLLRHLNKIEKLSERSKVPVVVLEEEKHLDRAKAMMGEDKIYIPTVSEDPEPLAGWNSTHTLLRKAGVETILIGGMLAECYHDRELSLNPSEAILQQEIPLARVIKRGVRLGCIHEAYKHFSLEGFKKVRIMPGLIYPDKVEYEKPKEKR